MCGGQGWVPLLILTWVWLPGPGCLEPGQDGQLGLSLGSCWIVPCSCSGEGFHPAVLCPCLELCAAHQFPLLPSLRPLLIYTWAPSPGAAHPWPLASMWHLSSTFLFFGSLPSHTSSPLCHKSPLALLWASKLLLGNSVSQGACIQTLLPRSRESWDMGYLADKSPARMEGLELRFSVE